MRDEYFDSFYEKKRGISVTVFAFVLLLAVFATFFASYLYFDGKEEGGTTTTVPVSVQDSESAFCEIYKQNCESVVKITAYVDNNGTSEKYSSASGFVYTEDGYIITNNHVLENADLIKVTLYSGKSFEATEIGRDERSEVAVLKIDSTERLKAVTVGDSDTVKVGQYAIAIGNPMGYDFTMSIGNVSGINRIIDQSNFRYEMIQIDTHINSGNSGGPLFNINGEVIGINTLKESNYGSTAAVEGLGFAIPINTAVKTAEQLISNGKVTRAAINATVGNKIVGGEYVGVYIDELTPNGAAEKGGLEVGDVICEFNGVKITVMNDLMEQLDKCSPNDKVNVKVLRNGQELNFYIILGTT